LLGLSPHSGECGKTCLRAVTSQTIVLLIAVRHSDGALRIGFWCEDTRAHDTTAEHGVKDVTPI